MSGAKKRVSDKNVERKLKSLLTHTFHIGINSLYRGIFRRSAAVRWAVNGCKSRTLDKNSIFQYREK